MSGTGPPPRNRPRARRSPTSTGRLIASLPCTRRGPRLAGAAAASHSGRAPVAHVADAGLIAATRLAPGIHDRDRRR
jgi:hypothetical protein